MSWFNLRSWFGDSNSGNPADQAPKQSEVDSLRAEIDSVKKSLGVGFGAAVATLRGGRPGGWASDHRAESNHFTGWNYIAIHAICCQAASADVNAYSDGADPRQQSQKKSRRKSLRAVCGSVAHWKALYGQDDQDTTPLEPDHLLVKILKRPNKGQSGAMFRYQCAQQLRLTGSCLIWNVPSKAIGVNGKPLPYERYVLPTACATPLKPSAEFPMGAWRIDGAASRYSTIDEFGYSQLPGWQMMLGAKIDARQVQVIRYPHPTWLDDGQSPLSACAMWTDTADEIDSARFNSLKNGLDPSIWLDLGPDSQLGQDELDRVDEKVNKKYSGPTKTSKAIVTQGDMKVTNYAGQSAKEMCYPEAWKDTKDASLAIHSTPPVAVGLQEAGAYAAYLASRRAWKDGAIQPLLDMLAESDTEELAPRYGVGITIEIEAQDIDDSDLIEKQITNDLAGRIRTRNEIRAIRGLPPLTPEQGGEELVGNGAGAAQPMGAAGDIGAGDQADTAVYANTSRQQWKRNIGAIRDVLTGVSDGSMNDTLAQTLLESLALPPEKATALIQDAKDGVVDDPEVVDAGQQVSPSTAKSTKSQKRAKTLQAALEGAQEGDVDWLVDLLKPRLVNGHVNNGHNGNHVTNGKH